MNKLGTKIISIIIVFLLLVIAGVFACLFHTTLTANADALPSFEISTATGQDWTLKYEGVSVQSLSGNFFNFEDEDDPDQPAVVFKNLIRSRLSALGRGEDEYTLSFKMPTPTISFENDMDSNPYTEVADECNIILLVNYTGVLSSAATSVEYKQASADDSAYTVFPTAGGYRLRFGQGVNKGDYSVRVKVGESFEYLGREYNPVSTSNALECHITDTELPDRLLNVPDLPNFEYGLTLAEIAARASELDRYGTWTISSPQNPDMRLIASENTRTVKMDFQSINANYNVKKNVSVPVVVGKRNLSVYVDSVSALIGQPLRSDIGYSVDSTLAPGDTLESIGFKIDTHEVDINTEGEYSIYATVKDENYNPITRTYESQHILHSFYRVHSTRVRVVADDFREIFVERPEGFIGITLSAYRMGNSVVDEADPSLADYSFVTAYVIVATDEDGNVVRDLGELTVTMTKREDDHAVAYEENGEIKVVPLEAGETFSVKLPNNVIGFSVLKKHSDAILKTVEWNDTLTALSVLIILFVVASWVVVCIYVAKRRLIDD